MQRLLADAQKLTGQKYDISNLSDVYNAIHAIQKEMGVTGTTAKEATETISGSVGALKAAWDNFLSGAGTSKEVIETFLVAAKNIGNELVKIIPDVANGIIQLINGLLPQIPGMIQKLLPVVIQGIITLTQGLISMLPTLLQMFLSMIIQLVTAIAQALPTMIPAIVDAILGMIPILIDNLPLFIEAGIQLIIGILTGIIQALPTLLGYIPRIIVSIVKALSKLPGMLAKQGLNAIISLAQSIVGNIVKVANAAKKIGQKVFNTIKTLLSPSGLANIGKNLVTGLWNGIQNAKDWVLDKIKGFGKSIINGIKSIFGIHSPSKVMFKIGQYVVEGFKNGMTSKDFKNVGSKLAKNFINGISSGLEKIKSVTDKLKSNLSSVDLFSDGKITDLGAIKDQVINYGKNLSKLKSKLPSNLYEEILGMGREEGLEYTNQLLEMDKGSLNEYVNNWKAIQKQSSAISKRYYDAEVKALKDNYTNQLKKQFGTVKHTMGGLGKNAMKGLYDGMKSELKKLSGTSKKISNSVVSSFKKSLKIKSPSRVMYELGNYTTQGFINGITSLKDELNKQMSKTFNLSPNVTNSASTHFSPNVNVVNNIEMKQDPLGQMVNNIKTFQGGAKNDYNYGKA